MKWILFFNLAIICGLICSQVVDIGSQKDWVLFVSQSLLSYILIEVGVEFTLKKNIRSYLKDHLVAFFLAMIPWGLTALYFYVRTPTTIEESIQVARFSSPTASGMLFSMLTAAGIGTTWLFKKIEVLAIIDDLDAILIFIPLKLLFFGYQGSLLFIFFLSITFLTVGIIFLHKLPLKSTRPFMLLYALIITSLISYLNFVYGIEIDILLPSFALGMLLVNPHQFDPHLRYRHEHAYFEPQQKLYRGMHLSLKLIFMFSIGLLVPLINLSQYSLLTLLLDSLMLSLILIMGKAIPVLCLFSELSLKERLALVMGLSPRGEIGVYIIAALAGTSMGEYGIHLAGLTFVINLSLSALFVLASLYLGLDKKFNPLNKSL